MTSRGDYLGIPAGPSTFKTVHPEPIAAETIGTLRQAIALIELYVRQPGAKDRTRPLCWNVVNGQVCIRQAIKGRLLCWHCERGKEC